MSGRLGVTIACMAIIGQPKSPQTETVQIEVPLVTCVVCNQKIAGLPIRLESGVVVEWEAPKCWRRALIDDTKRKNDYVYFCPNACVKKLPAIQEFGDR